MPRFESACRHSLGYLPAGRPFVVGGYVRSGVEPQPRDDRVSVTVARINRDPFSAATFSVLAKLRRADWRSQQASAAERIGDGSRTIIAAINERSVSTAKNVGLAKELVGGPDRAFDG